MQSAQTMTDLVVTVRYPGYTRRAIIRQSRKCPAHQRLTKSGREYAQIWHVIKWCDEEQVKMNTPKNRKRNRKAYLMQCDNCRYRQTRKYEGICKRCGGHMLRHEER